MTISHIDALTQINLWNRKLILVVMTARQRYDIDLAFLEVAVITGGVTLHHCCLPNEPDLVEIQRKSIFSIIYLQVFSLFSQ